MKCQRAYNGLDLFKIIMAGLVVGIHAGYIVDSQDYPPVVQLLQASALPFFFITSGFLLENKILKNEQREESVLKQSLLKNTRIYLLWMLCYLPIALFVYCNNQEPWQIDVLNYFRGLIFVGETPYSWPLWYMLALIVSVLVILILRRLHFKAFGIWVAGLLLTVAGYLLKEHAGSTYPIVHTLARVTLLLFGTFTRNGLFEGLVLVSTGVLIRKYIAKIPDSPLLPISLLAIAFCLYLLQLPVAVFISGTAFFLIAISMHLKDATCYKTLRVESMFVYFTHMFFIFFINTFLKESIVGESLYLTWICVFLAAFILSMILNRLRARYSVINYFIE